MNADVRIARWLKGAVYRKHATTIILLRNRPGRKTPIELQSFFVDDDSGEEGFSEREAADEIFAVAGSEANATGGQRHRFQLQADSKDEANVASMSFQIIIKDREAVADYEAGEEGLTAQLMRHNEMLTRTLIGGVGAQFQAMSRTIETLGERLAASEERASEMVDQLHATHDQRLLLAAETSQVEASTALAHETQAQFVKWIPTIVAHFMRKNGGDLAEGLPEPLVEVLKTIEPEQMLALTEVLTPEQSAVIGELYLSVQDEDKGKPL